MTAPAFPTGLKRPGTEAHVRRTLSSSMFLHAASRLRLRAAILVQALQETLLLKTGFSLGFKGGLIPFGNGGAEMLSAPYVWVRYTKSACFAAVRAGALFWGMTLADILVFIGIFNH